MFALILLGLYLLNYISNVIWNSDLIMHKRYAEKVRMDKEFRERHEWKISDTLERRKQRYAELGCDYFVELYDQWIKDYKKRGM